jgi:hypothetical protein
MDHSQCSSQVSGFPAQEYGNGFDDKSESKVGYFGE